MNTEISRSLTFSSTSYEREHVRFFSEVSLDKVGKGQMLGSLQFVFYPRRLGLTEELQLLEENGLGDLIGSYLLNGSIEASCLKDRIVHSLISIDSLLECKRDGYFLLEFKEITQRITRLVTSTIFDNPLKEDVLGILLITPKHKKNKTKQTLKNVANFVEQTFSVYIQKLLEMYKIYSNRNEVDQELIKEKIKASQYFEEGVEEINHSNVIMATASNWHYQHLKNVQEHFLNRIRGTESIVSIMSNYEVLKLYALLKVKVKTISTSLMSLNGTEIRILRESQTFLEEVVSAKEQVAMVNKLIANIASPKQRQYLEHHQNCMDEFAKKKFRKFLIFFSESIKKSEKIVEGIHKKILDECLVLSFNGDMHTKKEFFVRLIELIDYRLKGENVPKHFSTYVNALSNQGSLRGQLDNLGEYVYLTGEKKGKKIIAEYILSERLNKWDK